MSSIKHFEYLWTKQKLQNAFSFKGRRNICGETQQLHHRNTFINIVNNHQKLFNKCKHTFNLALEGPSKNKSNKIHDNGRMTLLQNKLKSQITTRRHINDHIDIRQKHAFVTKYYVSSAADLLEIVEIHPKSTNFS